MPSSFSSNFSLSDSDIVTLDMTDDDTKPAAPGEEEEDESAFPTTMDVFEKEGSLNSSMITIIVSFCMSYACYTPVFYRRYSLIQVDDIHFRLDSHFLQRESKTLNAITSGTDSIRLQNVTVAEFRALWRFFYEG